MPPPHNTTTTTITFPPSSYFPQAILSGYYTAANQFSVTVITNLTLFVGLVSVSRWVAVGVAVGVAGCQPASQPASQCGQCPLAGQEATA